MWNTVSQAINGSASSLHTTQTAVKRKSSTGVSTKQGKSKRVTLTSKHNWWLIDVEEEDDGAPSTPQVTRPLVDPSDRVPVDVSPPHFQAPVHPSSIFVHPAAPASHPTTYSQHTHSNLQSSSSLGIPAFPFPAPSNSTSRLLPFSSGSTSELFKCIVKKPAIVQLEINGDMQTNATDVMVQFLAELRVYSTLKVHRNFPAYLGSLEGVGMVLEFVEGKSLLDVLREAKAKDGKGLEKAVKVKYWDQMVDGLTYLHSFGLSHGDLSLLNVLVTRTNTLKILDFGRSTSVESKFIPPSEPLPEPDVSVFAPPQPTPPPPPPPPPYSQVASRQNSYGFGYDPHRPSISRTTSHSITVSLPSPSFSPPSSRPSTPRPYKQKIEQIHPGTRPFTAPEILREECTDPILADAYSFGMIMFCVDLGGLVDIDQRKQRRGEMPDIGGCDSFGFKLSAFLADVGERKRLSREDFIDRTP